MVEMIVSHVMAALACRKGVTAMEYGVIAAGIVLLVAAAAAVLGPQISDLFGDIGAKLTAAPAGA
jgi:Flp pilus assembly pilin Flp